MTLRGELGGGGIGEAAGQVRANEDQKGTGTMLLGSTENIGGECEVRVGDYNFNLKYFDCGELKKH